MKAAGVGPQEKAFSVLIAAASLTTVCVSTPFNAYVLYNLGFCLMPHLITLIILSAARMRPAVIAAPFIAYTMLYAALSIIIRRHSDPSAALGWIYYVLPMPGAAAGVLGMLPFRRRLNEVHWVWSASISLVTVSIGMLISPFLFACFAD